MSSRSAIRAGLATVLANGLTGIRAHAYTPRQVNPPAMVVIELDQRPSTFQKGAHDYTAVVRLLVGGDVRPAQEKIDEFMDQVEDVIDASPTLDGTVDDATWSRTRGDSEGLLEMGGTNGFATYTVIDFEVEIVG